MAPAMIRMLMANRNLVGGQVNGLDPWTSIGGFTFVHIDRNIVTTKLVIELSAWSSCYRHVHSSKHIHSLSTHY
jgi:hypothetical protein